MVQAKYYIDLQGKDLPKIMPKLIQGIENAISTYHATITLSAQYNNRKQIKKLRKGFVEEDFRDLKETPEGIELTIESAFVKDAVKAISGSYKVTKKTTKYFLTADENGVTKALPETEKKA